MSISSDPYAYLDADSLSFFEGFDFHGSPLRPLDLEDRQVDVFEVEGEGFMLPHIQTVQNIYINTTRTRAHLANPEKTEFIVGEIRTRPIETLGVINDELWRKGSNMTLSVFNAFCSLLTRVSRPTNLLFDPARRHKKTPYYGMQPQRIYCSAVVTIQDDSGQNNRYLGIMPAGMFLVLMVSHAMATTPTTYSKFWGNTREFVDRKIAEHLYDKARTVMQGLSVESGIPETSNRFHIETLVLLSKRVEKMVQVLADLVQTPEPIPSNSKTAENCPSCSRRVSTATPRHKLQRTDEEYERDNDDMVGQMRLLKIPIRINSMQTSRHIYICSFCNDDERPLRFFHLSKTPKKRKRSQPKEQRYNKRRGSNRINDTIERNLEIVDFIATSFLSDQEKEEIRSKANLLRDELS